MGNHWGDIYLCVLPTKMLGGRVPPVPPIIAVGLLWKNVAYFPFNSWLSFQRLCRLLWGSSICSDDSQEARHARRMHSRKHASFASPKHFLRECTNFGCCTPIFTTAQTAFFHSIASCYHGILILYLTADEKLPCYNSYSFRAIAYFALASYG